MAQAFYLPQPVRLMHDETTTSSRVARWFIFGNILEGLGMEDVVIF
jgi:hypothetical protein